MANGALHKVTELTSDTRHAMESVIGRSLREDEVITVNVFKPSPTGQARKEASRRLLDRIDRTAQKEKSTLRLMKRWIMFDIILNESHPRYRDSRSDERQGDGTSPALARHDFGRRA